MPNLKNYCQKVLHLFTLLIIVSSAHSCTSNTKQEEMELAAVARIRADVALYEFHYKLGASRMREVISAAEELLSAIHNPENELTEDQVALNVHKLTWLWLAAIPTSEYVSMVNSGEISLVSSDRLRRKFKEMNSDLEKLLQFEELQISYVNQELRPFLNKRIDKTVYYTSQNFNTSGPQRVPSPFENPVLELLKDREFANLLVDVLFFTERIMLPYDRLNTIMADMNTIINEDYPSVLPETYGPH